MRRSLSVVLALTLALSLMSVGAASAKAPGTGDRTGDLVLSLNFGVFPPGAGPHQDIVWFGTVTFDEGTFGVVYYTVTTHGSEVVSHWTETWEMHEYHDDLFVVAEDSGVLEEFNPIDGPVVVGTDSGMTHWKKLTWVGNGSVDEAIAPFEQWQGRTTHIAGSFNLVEGTATGTVRLN